jgi:hypothetical protein
MKNYKPTNKNLLLPITVAIICSIFFTNCSSHPKKYSFSCNQQKPEIINTYIPKVLFDMGYEAKKNDSIPNSFVATKKIVSTNYSKGVENQYIQMHITFMFDTAQSVLTQHYIKEFNGKKKISVLNNQQLKIFEPDANLFLEKMIFYCNPEFKGR